MKRLLGLVWGIIAILGLALVWRADMTRILDMTPDDAYYFIQIAKNIVEHGRVSFDGTAPTNGFHPLWTLLLSTLYLASRAGNHAPEFFVRTTLSFQVLLTSGALTTLSLLMFRRFGPVSMAVLPLSLQLFLNSINAMESALTLTLLALLLAYSVATDFPTERRRPWFGMGVLAGLVMLARLDMAFFCILFSLTAGIAAWRRTSFRDTVPRAVLFGLGTFILVVPYLASNVLYFKTGLTPISGLLKMTSAGHLPWSTYFAPFHMKYVVVALAYVLMVGIVFARRRSDSLGPDTAYHIVVLPLAASTLLHLLHSATSMHWAVFGWHFYYYAVPAILGIPWCLRVLTPNAPQRRLALGLAVFAVSLAFAQRTFVHSSANLARQPTAPGVYEGALWARGSMPGNATFAMKDCGIYGYYSCRPTVNLDGLVNNLDLQEAIQSQHFNDYLRQKGVGYLVQHAFWNNDQINLGTYTSTTLSYYSHFYNVTSDPVLVHRSDEVFRSAPYYDGPHRTVLLVWKLSDRSADL